MARIETYIQDVSIHPQDKVIGTDYNNNNATKNFSVSELTTYISDVIGPHPDNYVSNVVLNGTALEFTGVGTGFAGHVDLSSLVQSQTDGVIPNVVFDANTNELNFQGTGGGFNGIISLASLAETLTALQLSNNILRYSDEDGIATNIDLTPYAANDIDYVSNAALVGTEIQFTAIGNAFGGAVDLAPIISQAADNYVSNVTLQGVALDFTGVNNGYSGAVDLSRFTYDLTSSAQGANVGLKLTDGTGAVDKVLLVAGSNITLTDNGSNEITISSTGGSGGSNDGYINDVNNTADPHILDFTGVGSAFNGSVNLPEYILQQATGGGGGVGFGLFESLSGNTIDTVLLVPGAGIGINSTTGAGGQFYYEISSTANAAKYYTLHSAQGGTGVEGFALMDVTDANNPIEVRTAYFTGSGSTSVSQSLGANSELIYTIDTPVAPSYGSYLSLDTQTNTLNHDNTGLTTGTSAASPAAGGSFTVIDTVTTNATGHVTALNTKTVTLPADEDTTYTYGSGQNGNDVDLRLAGSNGVSTNVKLVAGTNITLNDNGANEVTIDGAASNAYALLQATGGGGGTGFSLIETNSNTTVDTVLLVPGANIGINTTTGANGEFYYEINNTAPTLSFGTYLTETNGTVDHDATTRTNTTSTAAPAHGATFTVVDGVTTNATGHVTGTNLKTVTMPAAADESCVFGNELSQALSGYTQNVLTTWEYIQDPNNAIGLQNQNSVARNYHVTWTLSFETNSSGHRHWDTRLVAVDQTNTITAVLVEYNDSVSMQSDASHTSTYSYGVEALDPNYRIMVMITGDPTVTVTKATFSAVDAACFVPNYNTPIN